MPVSLTISNNNQFLVLKFWPSSDFLKAIATESFDYVLEIWCGDGAAMWAAIAQSV